MKKFFWIISIIVLIIVSGVCSYLVVEHQKEAKILRKEQQSRAEILNYKKPLTDKAGTFIWLYAYQKNSTKNKNYIDSQLKLARKTDFKYVVLPIVFKKGYVKNGKFDFSEFDGTISVARKNHLIPIIEFSADSPQDNQTYKVHSKKVIDKYCKMIRVAIKRYRGRGVVWQMWNEPNSLFWFNQSENGNEKSLTKAWNGLGRKMQGWVRQYDPSSVFLGGNLAGNYVDSELAIKSALNTGLASYPDAISNHPYLSSQEPRNGAPENLFTVNSRRKLISFSTKSTKNSLKKIPLVTTEFGYSMKKSHHGVWSEGDQANYLARSLFVLDMMHQPIISLYSLVDEGNGDSQWGMYRGIAPNYIAKQSGKLVMELLSNLNGYTFNNRVQLDSQNDYVLKYEKKGYSNRYVCWTLDANKDIWIAHQKVTLSQTPQIVYDK